MARKIANKKEMRENFSKIKIMNRFFSWQTKRNLIYRNLFNQKDKCSKNLDQKQNLKDIKIR